MFKVTAATLALASLPFAASGATFFGSTEGTFRTTALDGTTPVVGAATNSCLIGTASGADTGVAWGESGACPDLSGRHQDSRILLQDFAFSQDVTAAGTKVQIGQIHWINRANDAAVDFAPVATLSLSIGGAPAFEAFETLRFMIRNTKNASTNPADMVIAGSFTGFGQALPVALGGALSLDGFSFALTGDSGGESLRTEVMANGTTRLYWSNPEDNHSGLAIFAHVSPAAAGVDSVTDPAVVVPLPAALWLLAGGLAALLGLRRRA